MSILFFLIFNFLFFFYINSFIARRLNLYDFPTYNKIHKKKTPLTGGFYFIVIIFFNIIFFNTDQLTTLKIIYILLPFIFLFIIGFYDDKIKILSSTRVILIFFLLLLFFSLDNNLVLNEIKIFLKDFYFFKKTNTLIFTTLCVLTLIILINLIDGVDGLAISFVINWFLILILFYNYDFKQNYIFFLGCLIFLYFNLTKKIFLGSSGNMILSFFIGKESITIYNQNSEIDLLSISLIFFLPFLDSIRLFFSRIFNQKSPFQRDLKHLHHYLYKSFKNYTFVIYNLLIFISVALYNIYKVNIFLCYASLLLLYITFLIKAKAQ